MFLNFENIKCSVNKHTSIHLDYAHGLTSLNITHPVK